jgi:hypothetical protein
VILGLTSNILIVAAFFVNQIMDQFLNKKLFKTSFSEGNSSNVLEIISRNQHDELFNSPILVSFNKSDGEYIYRLSSSGSEILKQVSNQYQNNAEVISIKYSSG